jgi:thioesterase domain-containing protein
VFWVNPGYQQLAVINQMGPEQPVYCLYRDKPDPLQPPLTFPEVAAFHVESMRQVAAHGPYSIIGYCVYGAIAYQMACLLREQGQAVVRLIMIDPADPALSRINSLPQPLASQLVFQFHRAQFHLKKIQALPSKDKFDYLHHSFKRLSKSIEELAKAQFLLKHGWPGPGKQVPSYLLEVHQADIFAMRMHRLQGYPGSAILLRPRTVPKGAHEYSNRRWAQLITGALEFEELPGDSESIWVNPDSEPLCRRIMFHLAHEEGFVGGLAAPPARAPASAVNMGPG